MLIYLKIWMQNPQNTFNILERQTTFNERLTEANDKINDG